MACRSFLTVSSSLTALAVGLDEAALVEVALADEECDAAFVVAEVDGDCTASEAGFTALGAAATEEVGAADLVACAVAECFSSFSSSQSSSSSSASPHLLAAGWAADFVVGLDGEAVLWTLETGDEDGADTCLEVVAAGLEVVAAGLEAEDDGEAELELEEFTAAFFAGEDQVWAAAEVVFCLWLLRWVLEAAGDEDEDEALTGAALLHDDPAVVVGAAALVVGAVVGAAAWVVEALVVVGAAEVLPLPLPEAYSHSP